MDVPDYSKVADDDRIDSVTDQQTTDQNSDQVTEVKDSEAVEQMDTSETEKTAKSESDTKSETVTTTKTTTVNMEVEETPAETEIGVNGGKDNEKIELEKLDKDKNTHEVENYPDEALKPELNEKVESKEEEGKGQKESHDELEDKSASSDVPGNSEQNEMDVDEIPLETSLDDENLDKVKVFGKKPGFQKALSEDSDIVVIDLGSQEEKATSVQHMEVGEVIVTKDPIVPSTSANTVETVDNLEVNSDGINSKKAVSELNKSSSYGFTVTETENDNKSGELETIESKDGITETKVIGPAEMREEPLPGPSEMDDAGNEIKLESSAEAGSLSEIKGSSPVEAVKSVSVPETSLSNSAPDILFLSSAVSSSLPKASSSVSPSLTSVSLSEPDEVAVKTEIVPLSVSPMSSLPDSKTAVASIPVEPSVTTVHSMNLQDVERPESSSVEQIIPEQEIDQASADQVQKVPTDPTGGNLVNLPGTSEVNSSVLTDTVTSAESQTNQVKLAETVSSHVTSHAETSSLPSSGTNLLTSSALSTALTTGTVSSSTLRNILTSPMSSLITSTEQSVPSLMTFQEKSVSSLAYPVLFTSEPASSLFVTSASVSPSVSPNSSLVSSPCINTAFPSPASKTSPRRDHGYSKPYLDMPRSPKGQGHSGAGSVILQECQSGGTLVEIPMDVEERRKGQKRKRVSCVTEEIMMYGKRRSARVSV